MVVVEQSVVQEISVPIIWPYLQLNVKKLMHLVEAGFSSPGISIQILRLFPCQKGLRDILSVLNYCICGLPRMGPNRRSTSPFGGAGHARGCAAMRCMQRDFMWLSMICLKLIHHPCRSHMPSSAMFSTKSCRSFTGILFVAYYLD